MSPGIFGGQSGRPSPLPSPGVPGEGVAARISQTSLASKDPLPYYFGRTICRIAATLMFDLKTYGVRNVPRQGGILLVCNHQSYLDPIMFGVQLVRPISFFAKAELFKNPAFGAFLRSLRAFPVRRGEADLGAMKEAIRRAQQGEAVLVFPEGTRSLTGQIKPFEAGIGLLARRAGVPIVPAVIDGTLAAWSKGDKLPRPHPVRVAYGPPMDMAGLKPAEIVRRLRERLQEMQGELRGGLAISPAPPPTPQSSVDQSQSAAQTSRPGAIDPGR
jgi:1-acyl-sn-glycerol-3-phosphate acyltransferase